MSEDKHSEYTVPALITSSEGSSYSVGYIYLQPQLRGQGVVKRTLIVNNSKGKEVGIHIDFDKDGRIFGIEVMDGGLLPPKIENGKL